MDAVALKAAVALKLAALLEVIAAAIVRFLPLSVAPFDVTVALIAMSRPTRVSTPPLAMLLLMPMSRPVRVSAPTLVMLALMATSVLFTPFSVTAPPAVTAPFKVMPLALIMRPPVTPSALPITYGPELVDVIARPVRPLTKACTDELLPMADASSVL